MTGYDLVAFVCCDRPPVVDVWHEPALLVHGGYGAVRTTSRTMCRDCGVTLSTVVSTDRPPTTTHTANSATVRLASPYVDPSCRSER